MSFIKRKIRLSVQLGSGGAQTNQPKTFAEGGDTADIENLRMSVRITTSGSPAGAQAHVEVYGLSRSLMNQLSTLGMVLNQVSKNALTISAGNDEDGLTAVFTGTIVTAYADLNRAPDVPFIMDCQAGLVDAALPVPPTTFSGQAAVADIMSGFARQAGLAFENNGVNVSLQSPYFSGNIRTQIRDCAEAANINAEQIGTVLAIWPKGGSRDTRTVPIVSRQTGLVQYPTFAQNMIMFKTLFNPQIAFGGLVNIQSAVLDNAQESITADPAQVLPADGQWAVYKLDHALDTQVPKGQWFSVVQAYNPKYPRSVSPGVPNG